MGKGGRTDVFLREDDLLLDLLEVEVVDGVDVRAVEAVRAGRFIAHSELEREQ